MGDMRFNGRLGNAKLRRDLLIGATRREQRKDLALASCELTEFRMESVRGEDVAEEQRRN